jgi:cell division cycle 2-like
LLLGTKEYETEIDMWSIGCIFGELCLMEPLLQGTSEIDQLAKIFELVGVPTEETWPTFKDLPNAKTLNFPRNKQTYPSPKREITDHRTGSLLQVRLGSRLTSSGIDLLSSFLTLDPSKRITAAEALQHPYFKEDPKPKHPEFFPSFPSKGSGEKRKRWETPSAPKGGGDAPALDGAKFGGLFRESEEGGGPGFTLKFG